MRIRTCGSQSLKKTAGLHALALLLVALLAGCVEWTSDTPEATAEPTAEVSAIVTRPVEEARTYTVQRGDTLALIARREEVPLSALVELNALAADETVEVER